MPKFVPDAPEQDVPVSEFDNVPKIAYPRFVPDPPPPPPPPTAWQQVKETAGEVYDWSQTPPEFMLKVVQDAEKTLAEAPPDTGLQKLAMADLFVKQIGAGFTTPLNLATLGVGPVARGVSAVIPRAAPIAEGVASVVNALGLLPAAEQLGGSLGELSVIAGQEGVPLGEKVKAGGQAAGAALMTGMQLLGVKYHADRAKGAWRARDVVSDAEWNEVRDQVRYAQAADEGARPERLVNLPGERRAALTDAERARIAALPEAERRLALQDADRLISEGEWNQVQNQVRYAEGEPKALPAPSEAKDLLEAEQRMAFEARRQATPKPPSPEKVAMEQQVKNELSAQQTAEFNDRVKRVITTYSQEGVKLTRPQAAELARMMQDNPREYSYMRKALLERVKPEEPLAEAPTKAQLKSLEDLSPEMLGIKPEPPEVEMPAKKASSKAEVPVLEGAAKTEGLGEARVPSPGLIRLERPMYDSGFVDDLGNKLWVDEWGRAVDPKTYQNPREVVRTPAEKQVFQQQLAERVAFDEASDAVERVNNLAPSEAVIVSTPESAQSTTGNFIGPARPGTSLVSTATGPAEVPNTSIYPASKQELSKVFVEPKVRKNPDSSTGGWLVTVGNNEYRIFRDPENRWWYLDAPGHFTERVLSTETKNAAIQELVENEDKWLKRISREEARIAQSKLANERARQAAAKVAEAPVETAPGELVPTTTTRKVAAAPSKPATKGKVVSVDDEAAIEAMAAQQSKQTPKFVPDTPSTEIVVSEKPMPGLDSQITAIEVNLSSSTGTIPGIATLAKEAQTDMRAARLLSDIASESMNYLVRDIESAKVSYSPTTGLYGGELEASMGLTVSFSEADRAKVFSALTRFAQNFNQEQIHVRTGTTGKVGFVHPDKSFNTAVVSWKIKDMMEFPRARIEKIAKESGLFGFTVHDGPNSRLEAYYVGDPTNAANVKAFTRAVKRASESLGKGDQRVERLWIYGKDAIPYPKITGELPVAGTERNLIAQRIAGRLASRKVKPVEQAKAETPEQVKLQTAIGKAYEKLALDNLSNPKVRLAYSELANELLKQYDSVPVKVEILSGKGEPYKNSREMRTDVLGNNHLFIFGTDAETFGPPGVKYDNHPLLQDSGRVDVNGKPLLYNDLLRAVHDYYAHTMTPVQFGVLGEEAAWRNHMAMTKSPWARWALSSETRGQNSFVNYGPDAAWNRANPKQTKFAPQKTDLLPIEYAKTGDPKLDAEMDVIGKAKPSFVRERLKSSYSPNERGAINFGLLNVLGQTVIGGASGFVYGYNKDPNASVEDKIVNGMSWAAFGLAVGNPLLRRAVSRGVYRAKIPVSYFGPKTRKAVGGMDNFVIFTRSVLKEVDDVIRSEAPESAALSYKATKALDVLEDMRAKADPTDWYSAMQHLSNRGNANNVVDLKLRAAVLDVRSAIDDFTIDMIGRGMVQPGSDLEFTMMLNRGKYLTRTYRIFTDPDFKFDPVKQQRAMSEYVAQELLSGSTKPVSELWQDAYELTLFQLQKAQGTALAPNARSFALGNGIARVDGSILKPRKELSDAWRDMLGEIDDPVQASTITVKRMADIIASQITQSKMADVGVQIGIFSPLATGQHTIKLADASGDLVYGPLKDLYTTPEVKDALLSMKAYSSNGWMFRSLATTTGMAKVAKTVMHPISYAPNFFSSLVQPLSQGHLYNVIRNPSVSRDAFSVVFDTPFPSNLSQMQSDVPMLIRKGVLRQDVNLNDLIDTFRSSYVPNAASRMVTWVPASVKAAAKSLKKGAFTVYGKVEEFPRLIGFYAEVNRYSNALFGKRVDQLTTAEKAEAYNRAVDVTKRVYPNSQEVPDVVKKLSVSGALEPFVAFKYETLFRTPYNTFRIGMEDIQQGVQNRNPRLVAAGVSRISSYVGVLFGAYAINEAYNKLSGVSGEQDKAIRRILPKYDQDGMLIVTDFTPDELAYANQSYILPHSLPTAAIAAAIEGKTPAEAGVRFFKETVGSMIGDGGLLLKPAAEAITGFNDYGRRIYPQTGGKYVDVSNIKDPALQDTAVISQKVMAGALHAAKNFVPGAITEGLKWKKMASDEIGPDGQLYKPADLGARLGGIRVNRIDIPLQFERKAGGFFSRLQEAEKEFGQIRNRKDTTPEILEEQYQLKEQARKIIYREVYQYLRDGETLRQPKDQILKYLRDAGLPSDFLLGAMNGFYVPGRKEKTLTAREMFESMMVMEPAKKDAEWARIQASDPLLAKAMRPMIAEVANARTQEERLILSMDSNDGTRARVIAQMLLSLPQDQREAKFNELSRRGMIKDRTAVLLYHDPIESAKLWAEAQVRLQIGKSVPLPEPVSNSTPPTNPGATMKAPTEQLPSQIKLLDLSGRMPTPRTIPMPEASRVPPPTTTPKPSTLVEGKYYRDPRDPKNILRMVNGQLVPVNTSGPN